MYKLILTSSMLTCLLVKAETATNDFDALFSDAPKAQSRNEIATNMSSSQPKPTMATTTNSDIDYPGRGKSIEVFNATPNPLDGIGLSVFGEFLYWDSGCNTLTTTVGYNNPYGGMSSNNNDLDVSRFMNGFNTHFSPGLRLSLAHNLTNQGWGLSGSWTYYTNHKTNTYTQTDKLLLPTLSAANIPYAYYPGNQFIANQVSNWNLSYNQGDLVFGKEIYFSKYYSLRPNTGARYLQASDRLSLLTSGFNTNGTVSSYRLVKAHNNLSAFGFSGGVDNKFCLGYGLSLVNNLNVGLAYGQNKVAYYSSGETGVYLAETWDLKTKNLFPFVDAKLDLAWERSFYNDKLALVFSVGYEYHVLINGFTAMSVATLLQGAQSAYIYEQPNVQHTNLYMQGMNLGAALKF
jgi:hypothetical protein